MRKTGFEPRMNTDGHRQFFLSVSICVNPWLIVSKRPGEESSSVRQERAVVA
jgi:hypothetical protein